MSIFLLLSIGIVAAAIFGFIARLFRQPPVVGYLFAGLSLGVFQIYSGSEAHSSLQELAKLGVTLLLFLVGLEMSLRELKTIGKVVVWGGVGQIIITSVLGFLLSQLLGFNTLTSVYIGLALTFSSTIIVVKLLSEKKDLDSLYGKITIGFLLVQDIAAILALVFLSGFEVQSLSNLTFFWVLVKGLVLLITVWFLANFVLPKVFDRIAQTSNELLFVGSIAWMLFLAAIVSQPLIGFTPEIGGLLAGVALAHSSSHLQIASRVRPLRDFFITIFFLLLGAAMAVGLTLSVVLPALILSLFVIIVCPLVVLGLLGLLGHKKRTSFLASVAFAQVSEFSLILVALGLSLGHITPQVVSLVTLVAVVTMVVSTYLIMNGHKLYSSISRWLVIFEKKKVAESALSINQKFSGHIVLIGCHRLGERVLKVLSKRREPIVIIDFNPLVVERLTAQGFGAFYGDATDVETLESLSLPESKMVISTTGSVEDNLFLLEAVSKLENRPLMIFSAGESLEALILYEKGADYVIVPQIAGGDHLAHLLNVHGLARDYFKTLRTRHFTRLVQERF